MHTYHKTLRPKSGCLATKGMAVTSASAPSASLTTTVGGASPKRRAASASAQRRRAASSNGRASTSTGRLGKSTTSFATNTSASQAFVGGGSHYADPNATQPFPQTNAAATSFIVGGPAAAATFGGSSNGPQCTCANHVCGHHHHHHHHAASATVCAHHAHAAPQLPPLQPSLFDRVMGPFLAPSTATVGTEGVGPTTTTAVGAAAQHLPPPPHVGFAFPATTAQKMAALDAETLATHQLIAQQEEAAAALSAAFAEGKGRLAAVRAEVEEAKAALLAAKMANSHVLTGLSSAGKAKARTPTNKGEATDTAAADCDNEEEEEDAEVVAMRLAEKFMRSRYKAAVGVSVAQNGNASVAESSASRGASRSRSRSRSGGIATVAPPARFSLERAKRRLAAAGMGYAPNTALEGTAAESAADTSTYVAADGTSASESASPLPSLSAATPHLTLSDLEALEEALRERIRRATEEADALADAQNAAADRTAKAEAETNRLLRGNATLEAEIVRLRTASLAPKTAERNSLARRLRAAQTKLRGHEESAAAAEGAAAALSKEVLVFINRRERHEASLVGAIKGFDGCVAAGEALRQRTAERQRAVEALIEENRQLRAELAAKEEKRGVTVAMSSTANAADGIAALPHSAGNGNSSASTAGALIPHKLPSSAPRSRSPADDAVYAEMFETLVRTAKAASTV